jgi:hypothetical protein
VTHWHAYSYTGTARPKDADARDPLSATPPLTLSEWGRKPRQMIAGTFLSPADALEWLRQQLAATPPLPTDLPAETMLAYAGRRLARHPRDFVTRYYTASAYVVRDLMSCDGGANCPATPPPTSLPD